MVNVSQAYELFKRSMEQQLDFVVLVSYAVPVLQRDIALGNGGVVPVPLNPPDHFVQRRLSADQLTQFAKGYDHELARTLLITSFSYFEAYIKALVKEFLAFHGGPEQFASSATRRARRSLTALSPISAKAKRKLQEHEDTGKTAKYSVHSRELFERGFRFPSELLAPYGVARILEKFGKDKRQEMKASEIPAILVDAFQMDSFAQHSKRFDEIRKLRNDIAHGMRQQIVLSTAIDAGRDLRGWATAIDRHFVEHFFVVERHAP